MTPAASLHAQAEALRSRRLSAVEATELAFERCAEAEPHVRAFLSLDRERALEAAREADRLRAAGDDRPFLGLPTAVKDVTDVAGAVTTQGAKWRLEEPPATRDSLPVARLKAAGFIPIGKTNTPEFGFGAACTNSLQGPTATPHDLARSSGGSSGGSAAAVAAGVVTAAHGADFGGSVRTPAAFCGVVGFRPTPGRIADPARGLGYDTLASHGTLGWTVDDAAALAGAMAGADPRDPTSRIAPAELEPAEPERLRVVATADFGTAPMAQAVRTAFAEAVETLARRVSVSETSPDCTGAIEAFGILRAAVIHHNLRPLIDAGKPLAQTARWNAMRGAEITAARWLAAETTRSAVFRSFADLFEAADLIVTPAASVMPFDHAVDEVREIDGKPLASIIDYLAITSIVSLIGLPALVVPFWPCGGHLPIGLQLVAPPGGEGRLIAFGRLLQRELGCAARLPQALQDRTG